ncbi:MAG: RdgB/HAM1 family non-canonical purine NTP pyrophosphatase [Coprobacillus sp.]|nr:RdgB/HAM1 family non-canonical purine NTP pyrophosphatase [Coprobacillus sp.]
MNFEIILATSNKHKLKEVRDILSPHGIVLYGLSDLNLPPLQDKEGDSSYEENAFIKAKEVSKYTTYPIIADDTGLEIEALNNRPGIHSSRYIEECGGREQAFKNIIHDLEGRDRKAKFISTICLLNVEDKPLYFVGETWGHIREEVSQKDNGFGYDPIFYCEEINKTYSEISEQEKNQVSHRAKALKKLLTYLRIYGYISK